MEFNVHMSHLNPDNLVPETCKWACQSMGFSLAAFEAGTACMCKNDTFVESQMDVIDNCRDIPCGKRIFIILNLSQLTEEFNSILIND